MRRDEVRESRVECARSKQVVALHGYVDGHLEESFDGFEREILVVSRLYLCRQLEVCLVSKIRAWMDDGMPPT